MSKLIFTTIFALGAAAVLWMGSTFLGSDPLALAVTLVIGCVYTLGFVELVQFRQATAALANALTTPPIGATDRDTALSSWLAQLHSSLQNPVRLRIEGERVGLPAPVITPYLVGLLVMLGLLGTFVGMVETLRGAVFALEGTTELAAIRAGLAAPINGLSLAFGTSVAGVAASAALGLLSTLSRRERMLATRELDRLVATELREFSLSYHRQQTYAALQSQAQTLPVVAEKLQAMAASLERMGDSLSDKLTSNQQSFHQATQSAYAELASSVDATLRESLAQSGRLAGESIRPVVSDAMQGISEQARSTHQQLTVTAQEQLEALSARFSQNCDDVTGAWKSGLADQQASNQQLIAGMGESLVAFSTRFEGMSSSMLESLDKNSSSWLEQQQNSDQIRLQEWSDAFGHTHENTVQQLANAGAGITAELTKITDVQRASFSEIAEAQQASFANFTATQQSSFTDAGESQQACFAKVTADFESLTAQLSKQWQASGERLDELTANLGSELVTLRDEEQLRGQAAVERLAGLEATVANHLATLGNALEEPMTRLIETASETPRAAAEVISQLRGEISNNIERDNSLLEERGQLMAQLNTLSDSLTSASQGQQLAIEKLVSSSTSLLADIGTRFTEQVESDVAKAARVAEHFAGSAVEMSSLGEAFNLAVGLFDESNNKLIEHLGSIEQAMAQSTARSDEQMGYYVAQAREIIDQSLLSQKELFDRLQQPGAQQALVPAEAG